MLRCVSCEERMLELQSIFISAFVESIHVKLYNEGGYLPDEAGHLFMPKVSLKDGQFKCDGIINDERHATGTP